MHVANRRYAGVSSFLVRERPPKCSPCQGRDIFVKIVRISSCE